MRATVTKSVLFVLLTFLVLGVCGLRQLQTGENLSDCPYLYLLPDEMAIVEADDGGIKDITCR